MREWAVELQYFLTSGATNTQAKQRAVKACDDPDIREYLENFPSSLEQTDEQAFSALIEKIAPEKMTAEAVVFQLIRFLPVIVRAANVLRLPIEVRDEIEETLQGLTNICRLDIALAPSLAFILHVTGNFYSDTRAFDRAREAYEAARDIYKKLADSDPPTYEPDLAMALNNLGNLYSDIRMFDQAGKAYEAARDIYKKRAESAPPTYEPDLAGTLSNLGALYRTIRMFNQARESYEAARDIWEKLAESDRPTYKPDLAGTLNNLGNLYRDTRAFDQARESYEVARDIYKKLAESGRPTYEPDPARTLSNLGVLYHDTRAFDRAREAYEAARDIYTKLAESAPPTYGPDLARTLSNLGVLYRDTQASEQARETCETAVRLVEAHQTEGSDRRYLNKGQATAAYRFLLSEAITEPERAFALAAALRDGDARSSALGRADSQATQGVLADLQKSTGRPHALLVPTLGASNDTLTLGLITARQMQWWTLSCQGWEALFLGEPPPASRLALARQIWESLPLALQKALSPTITEVSEILVSGDPFWSAFPWELLPFGDGEEDFLGLHRGLTRIGPILAPRLSAQLQERTLGGGNKQMAVIAPHTTGKTILTGVLGEVAALKARIPQVGGELIGCETGEAAHDGWMREALAANPAILYYSGHGGIVANEEVLLLHTEPGEDKPQGLISYFGAYQLKNALAQGASFSHAPLVVLNSCVTGRTREHGGQREDLVSALLSQGAGAVIATALSIYDSVGEALGEALFSEAALTQPMMGAYLVEARRQLAQGICRDREKPTWGAWGRVHLHGNALGTPPLFVSEMKGD